MTRTLQHHCRSTFCLLTMMLALWSNSASGQQVENADFSADTPNPSAATLPQTDTQGFYTGPVIPTAALTTPARVLNGVGEIRDGAQIRVSLRFLSVDSETRASIYEKLDAADIKTLSNGASIPQHVALLDGLESEIRCTETIITPSRATTAVLSESNMKAIMQAITQSDHSKLSAAPSVVLFDGQTAEVNTTVQRPFLTGFERVEIDGKAHAKSSIEVFDEGTTVRMKASTLPTSGGTVDRIHLATELVSKSIVDVKSESVFGVTDVPVLAASPLHLIKSTVAAEELGLGQTLLVDPYVTKQVETEVTSGVPILSKIPYIARSFKNIGVVKQDQHMMVLMQPSIVSTPDDQAQSVNTALTQ